MSNTILTLFGEEFAPIPNQVGMKARVKKTTTANNEEVVDKEETPKIASPEIAVPAKEEITSLDKAVPATEKKVIEKKPIALETISPDEQSNIKQLEKWQNYLN